MTRQRARLEALEKRSPKDADLPIIFIKFCEGGHGAPIVSRMGMATVIGVGQIRPREGEAEEAFIRRAYAMRIAKQPLEELTDAELEAVLASADEAIEKELLAQAALL
jgi:hypothetical protein